MHQAIEEKGENHIMNKNLKIGIILLSIATFIFVEYLIYLGIELSDSIWENSLFGPIIPIIVGFYLIVPLLILFLIGFIQIGKSKKLSRLILFFLIVGVFAIPISSLAICHTVDQHIYNMTYTFTPIKWERADVNNRGLLIDSFRKQYDLVGQNIEIVFDLLGEPNTQNESQYLYDIGGYKGFSLARPYNYVINFDFDNIITGEYIKSPWY